MRGLGEVASWLPIDSLEDKWRPFSTASRSKKFPRPMTINATAAILLCLYVAVAKKQGANLAKISGTVQNDVFEGYIARGTYIYPVRPADAHRQRIFSRGARECAQVRTRFGFPATHIREAGSTPSRKSPFTACSMECLRPSCGRRRAPRG